jgi:hypothetical protein
MAPVGEYDNDSQDRSKIKQRQCLRFQHLASLSIADSVAFHEPGPPLAHLRNGARAQHLKRQHEEDHDQDLVSQPFGWVATPAHGCVHRSVELTFCCFDLSSHRVALGRRNILLQLKE